MPIRNDFLLRLLDLQQDGKQAISAPTNWSARPLLQVSTETDQVVADLCETMLKGTENNSTARWHFFVGSPGNGKSAAMGHLCRLLAAKKCQVVDEKGEAIASLKPQVIPYVIQVFEGKNKFVSAQIIQDASVVRDPFAAKVDPASELLDVLKTAWEKGISLIVCTNRGVLEKAYRDRHMDPAVSSTAWFKVLREITTCDTKSGESPTRRSFDCKKPAFEELRLSWTYLDNRSLVLGTDTFERLVKKATEDAAWGLCDGCDNKHLCPFRSNRDWLRNDDGRQKFLSLLEKAEIMSGQIVVFREALALISLLLAGCPQDYGTKHPCDWVRENSTDQNVFALCSRRLYMSLFASRSPSGLEATESVRRSQLSALKILSTIESLTPQASSALKEVLAERHPSIDVGVTRLLGDRGTIPALDPCRESLPTAFYDRWDGDFEAVADSVPSAAAACFTDLEKACISIWKELEQALELVSDHNVSAAHWALRRWSSNFLLHLGALLEGRSCWPDELEAFTGLLNLVGKPSDERTTAEKKQIKALSKTLDDLLNATSGNSETATIRLSDAVTLQGQWVKDTIKPSLALSATSGGVSLSINFSDVQNTVFGADMYVWLSRHANLNMDVRCIPQDLLTGVQDSRVRAASRGRYAFEKEEVELVVRTGEGEEFSLTRYDGDVSVSQSNRRLP
ncbi:MAG: hypothetical protein U0105_20625 [Candidatus Obscuribacterales bacterium]